MKGHIQELRSTFPGGGSTTPPPPQALIIWKERTIVRKHILKNINKNGWGNKR